MKKQEKKKTVWQHYITMAFLLLVGAACGIFTVMYMDRNSGAESLLYEELFTLAGLFAGLSLAVFVQVVVHEAGHFMFGLLSGYQFNSFRVFSFMWIKEDDKIRFRRLSIAGTGGQCLMIPPDMTDGKIPVILYNLGGPLMNMIAGTVFLGLYFVCSDIPFLAAILFLFSVIGFAFAIVNGVPMRAGGLDNDGYNAFSLTRNIEAMRSFWVQMKVNEQISKGIRPKDMPDEWFVVPPDEAMKNSMVAVMAVFACNRLIDAGRFEEAEKLMAHMLEIDSGITGIHYNLIVCDRIYIELITGNRKDILDGMLDKEQKKFWKRMKNFPSVLRTEYAYALLYEKNVEKSNKVREQFEKWARCYPYPGDVQSERELMAIADQKRRKETVTA